MHRIAIAILMVASGSALDLATAAQVPDDGSKAITATAIDRSPQSRAEATQGIDDAVAAALIGAISRQFDERVVQIKLDRVDSTPISIA